MGSKHSTFFSTLMLFSSAIVSVPDGFHRATDRGLKFCCFGILSTLLNSAMAKIDLLTAIGLKNVHSPARQATKAIPTALQLVSICFMDEAENILVSDVKLLYVSKVSARKRGNQVANWASHKTVAQGICCRHRVPVSAPIGKQLFTGVSWFSQDFGELVHWCTGVGRCLYGAVSSKNCGYKQLWWRHTFLVIRISKDKVRSETRAGDATRFARQANGDPPQKASAFYRRKVDACSLCHL